MHYQNQVLKKFMPMSVENQVLIELDNDKIIDYKILLKIIANY